jgi:hypothetical protein
MIAAEITREKLTLRLHEELPYQLTVETEMWEERKDGSVRIDQIVYVARDGHKGILLGHKGETIKVIGQLARAELESSSSAACISSSRSRSARTGSRSPNATPRWGSTSRTGTAEAARGPAPCQPCLGRGLSRPSPAGRHPRLRRRQGRPDGRRGPRQAEHARRPRRLFQRSFDLMTGARAWVVLAEGDEAEVDASIAKQRSFDRDLWVIEVEDRAGRHLLDEEGLAD